MKRQRQQHPHKNDAITVTSWRAIGGCGFRRAVRQDLVMRMAREIAENRKKRVYWHSIFNDCIHVKGMRTFNGSREMVYGRRDRFNSTEHTPQQLPALREWGRCVLRIVRTALAADDNGNNTQPKVRIADLGYVRTRSSVPQHWHRDVPLDHAFPAFSVFMPVNVVCPQNDPGAFRWKPLLPPANDNNHPALCGMPAEHPGDVFVMDSRVAHRGGALPRTATERYRVVAFASVVAVGSGAPDYGSTVPMCD